jgi:hypothetical protein
VYSLSTGVPFLLRMVSRGWLRGEMKTANALCTLSRFCAKYFQVGLIAFRESKDLLSHALESNPGSLHRIFGEVLKLPRERQNATSAKRRQSFSSHLQ